MNDHMRGEPLTSRQCWDVIAGAWFGRLLYTRNAMPLARPVPYKLWNRVLILVMDQTVRRSIMTAGLGIAALQVDDFDPAVMRGRSVNVYGEAGFLGEEGALVSPPSEGLPALRGDVAYGYLLPAIVSGERIDLAPPGNSGPQRGEK